MLKQAENTRDFFFIHFDSTSLFSHHMHVSACFVFVNLYGSHQLHHTAMLIVLLPFFVHIQMGKIMGPCIMCTTIESFNIYIYCIVNARGTKNGILNECLSENFCHILFYS